MRIVRPFMSLGMPRACVRVDSRLDKAKISSDLRVDADRPRLRAAFGGRKKVLTQSEPIPDICETRFCLEQYRSTSPLDYRNF